MKRRNPKTKKLTSVQDSERSSMRVSCRRWVFCRQWSEGLGFVHLGVKKSESVFTVRELSDIADESLLPLMVFLSLME